MISGGTRESEQPRIATLGYACQISTLRCIVLSSGRVDWPVQKRTFPAESISSTSAGWIRSSAASFISRSRTKSSIEGTVFSNWLSNWRKRWCCSFAAFRSSRVPIASCGEVAAAGRYRAERFGRRLRFASRSSAPSAPPTAAAASMASAGRSAPPMAFPPPLSLSP
eukprot:scaffold3129_cov35-Tisochrysis_lutea.AAC.1